MKCLREGPNKLLIDFDTQKVGKTRYQDKLNKNVQPGQSLSYIRAVVLCGVFMCVCVFQVLLAHQDTCLQRC